MRPRPCMRAALLAAMVGVGLLGGAGCAGVETAALSAGLAAAESGVTVLGRGKAQVYEVVKVGDAVEAVRRVAASLSLEPRGEHANDIRSRLTYRDERGDTIVVSVERRTATLSLLRADVGLLGDVGMSKTFLVHVSQEIRRMGAEMRPPTPEGE